MDIACTVVVGVEKIVFFVRTTSSSSPSHRIFSAVEHQNNSRGGGAVRTLSVPTNIIVFVPTWNSKKDLFSEKGGKPSLPATHCFLLFLLVLLSFVRWRAAAGLILFFLAPASTTYFSATATLCLHPILASSSHGPNVQNCHGQIQGQRGQTSRPRRYFQQRF